MEFLLQRKYNIRRRTAAMGDYFLEKTQENKMQSDVKFTIPYNYICQYIPCHRSFYLLHMLRQDNLNLSICAFSWLEKNNITIHFDVSQKNAHLQGFCKCFYRLNVDSLFFPNTLLDLLRIQNQD